MSISLNPRPLMTRHLVTNTRVFRDDPVTVVDVGARWGFNEEWKAFGDCLRVYCFEPDKEECERLNASAGANARYLPFALGAKTGHETLYHTRLSASTGLYRTNWDFFSRLLNRDNAVVVKEQPISVITLDDAMRQRGVQSIDFLKLDVEGAELDVLIGANSCTTSPTLIGVLSEFRFHDEINGAPVFTDLDQHLRALGFRLFDMHFSRQSRRALPYEGVKDHWFADGTRFFAYTVHGQIMDGDALYFRDLLIPANQQIRAKATPLQLLKAACFFEVYALSDCAAELIIQHRSRLEPIVDCDLLLDLLTQSFPGRRKYLEYMKAYFDDAWKVRRWFSLAKHSAKRVARIFGRQ